VFAADLYVVQEGASPALEWWAEEEAIAMAAKKPSSGLEGKGRDQVPPLNSSEGRKKRDHGQGCLHHVGHLRLGFSRDRDKWVHGLTLNQRNFFSIGGKCFQIENRKKDESGKR
jgi:hypothetical protein